MGDHPMPEWGALTSPEVAAVVANDPVVVLPLAATEQHGPHLPLSTDLEIGLGILRSAFQLLPEEFPAYVLPSLAVGASAEHLRFPGTLSLEAGSMTELIRDIGAALSGVGVRRLVLSNSHGGNAAAMQAAGLRLRREHGLLVVKASYFRFPLAGLEEFTEAEWRHGLHGGAVETSMMLYLRPDLVRTDQLAIERSLGEDLEASGTRIGASGPAAFAWLVGDLSPSGVVGNPALADPEAGKRLVDHFGQYLAEVIRDARAFPMERLVRGRGGTSVPEESRESPP